MNLQLELDFHKFSLNLGKENVINQDENPSYHYLFYEQWSHLSIKIIKYCKESRLKEVKDFIKLHEKLILEGNMRLKVSAF